MSAASRSRLSSPSPAALGSGGGRVTSVSCGAAQQPGGALPCSPAAVRAARTSCAPRSAWVACRPAGLTSGGGHTPGHLNTNLSCRSAADSDLPTRDTAALPPALPPPPPPPVRPSAAGLLPTATCQPATQPPCRPRRRPRRRPRPRPATSTFPIG